MKKDEMSEWKEMGNAVGSGVSVGHKMGRNFLV